VTGGATRTESVRRGVDALADDTDFVLIHDAARPLMPLAVFDRVLAALKAGSAAVIPTTPVVDTLVTQVRGTGKTEGGIDRDLLAGVQTPQGFPAEALQAAYRSVDGEFTDDAEIMRQAGHNVDSVPGDPQGFKITFPEDLARAEAVLGHSPVPRVGSALDVHAFDEASPLTLAGLEWPGEKGLSGHSDGDAVVHAIVDAILQAAGQGDLGHHFGTDRPEFAGASSQVFLKEALKIATQAGFRVSSVAVQIIGNRPKIGPRREEAQKHLSALVGSPVTLGATTTDGLGFTGRGEGIAASATAVLVPLA
jgi:2-C-methyl-D-erythritol 4-phosphate cytidylyltransferase/2-C-methyl-D-erythritol 2,4-cyclodiphosphate synthase